jgi:signal transduction histidine kinase
VETRAGLQTVVALEEDRRLPIAVEEELFWIAVEAFNNVVKHAQAQQVAVRLAFGEGSVQMEIEDDGVGFAPAQARQSGGLGLRGMEERAERIQATLEVASVPGRGTTVRVRRGLVEQEA